MGVSYEVEGTGHEWKQILSALGELVHLRLYIGVYVYICPEPLTTRDGADQTTVALLQY